MKNIAKALLFIAIAIITNISFAQETKGIKFENDTSLFSILAKAKSEGKNVFIDCYTTWCGPCKLMTKNVFPNDSVGEFYNLNFINISIDMEKSYGKEFAKSFEVHCYPTYLFLNNVGNLLHRASGAYSVQNFLNLGHDAITVEKQYMMFVNDYKFGDITPKRLLEYISLRKNSCLSVDDEIKQYFETQQETELTNKSNWYALNNFNVNKDSKVFQYLVSHREKFYKFYKKDSVDLIIKKYYGDILNKILSAKELDTLEYKKIWKQVINLKLTSCEQFLYITDILYYERVQNWQQYAATYKLYVENCIFDNAVNLNDAAYSFYENIDDPKYLNMAIDWIKCSIEIHIDAYNADTYASLLYKLNKKEEAEIMELKAIELAKINGENSIIKQLNETLQKIRIMK